MIYQNQVNAGGKIIDAFDGNCLWVVLFAQMQSGKTGTYLFTICEIIRKGMKTKGIIISGNVEIELRQQLVDDLALFINDKYPTYLQRNGILSREEYFQNLHGLLTDSIQIYWGAQLNSRRELEHDCAIIMDESHAAQNKGMRPDKWLRRQGISASGDVTKLDERNNCFLSVSATPFSELSDVVHHNQYKTVVHLEVGENYVGIEKKLIEGSIREYSDYEECLATACEIHKDESRKQYAIVRGLNDAKCEKIARIATQRGWIVKYYNSNRKDIVNLNALRYAPAKNTMIIVKGMARMGKVVPKQHIAFVMETANNSKTDTVLQGLLGRMCGHHEYSHIAVYLNENIIRRGDLEKYIQLCNRIAIIPGNATNVVTAKSRVTTVLNPIIPIRISLQDRTIDGSLDIINLMSDRAASIESIKAAARDQRWINANDEEQTAEIIQKILAFDYGQFEIRNASNAETYAGVPAKIHEILTSGIPLASLGSSCGINTNGTEIKLYWFQRAIPEYGINAGDVFIDARTTACNSAYKEKRDLEINIPKTTGKEIFDGLVREDETGELVDCNGGYNIAVPVGSMRNSNVMLLALRDFVRLSLQQTEIVGMPRKITSNQVARSKWQGILVSENVLADLGVNGRIYRELFRDFGVKLKLSKGKGPQRKVDKNEGVVRLAQISW